MVCKDMAVTNIEVRRRVSFYEHFNDTHIIMYLEYIRKGLNIGVWLFSAAGHACILSWMWQDKTRRVVATSLNTTFAELLSIVHWCKYRESSRWLASSMMQGPDASHWSAENKASFVHNLYTKHLSFSAYFCWLLLLPQHMIVIRFIRWTTALLFDNGQREESRGRLLDLSPPPKKMRRGQTQM